MIETLQIQSVAKTTSRDGTKEYFRVSTNRGQYSCWDEDLAKQLIVGQSFDLDISVNGKYKTIRAITERNAKIQSVVPSQAFINDPSIDKKVSYAKDIYGWFINTIPSGEIVPEETYQQYMSIACKLVKQAYKEIAREDEK